MKLVLDEAESDALRDYAAGKPHGVSCALVRAEVIRVAREHGTDAVNKARLTIGDLTLAELDAELLDAAGLLPVTVRTLDAIHLAAALALGDELSAVVTYDARMRRAAEQLGLTVVSPGAE